MLETRVGGECCREVLEKKEAMWCREVLEKKKGMWCREVQEKSVVEKCWKGVLFRNGGEECWSK